MSRRIVIATMGSYGDINPYLGLSLGLKAHGHRPVIATGAFYRETIERAGIEFHPMRPDADPTDRVMLARVMDARSGTEYILRDLVISHLRESYEDLTQAVRGADALITHPITFAGPIVAQQQRLTWISTVLAPISFFSAHELPVFSQFPWMRHAEKLGLWATRSLVRLAKRMTVPWTKPLHQLREELGLPTGMNPIFEGQHSPELVLALFSRVLADPQPDWPAQVVITGPMFYDGHDTHADVSADLRAFLDAGPPPIVFTLGTSAVNVAGDFFQQSLQAVKQLGCRALMLVGRHSENYPRGPLARYGQVTGVRTAFSRLPPRGRDRAPGRYGHVQPGLARADRCSSSPSLMTSRTTPIDSNDWAWRKSSTRVSTVRIELRSDCAGCWMIRRTRPEHERWARWFARSPVQPERATSLMPPCGDPRHLRASDRDVNVRAHWPSQAHLCAHP